MGESDVRAWRARGEHDDFYDLSIQRRDQVRGVFAGTRDAATFAVPIENGPDLRFAARVAPAARLRVVFHGAIVRGRDRYPRYDRIKTTLRTEDAFVSFADPTLVLDTDITLGWYTGAKDWDPVPKIREVIEEAMRVSGAEELVFLGGSGGGFAALRLSALFAGSGAFVFSPQTSIARYRGRHFARLMEVAYDGAGEEEAYTEYPGRFEVVTSYADSFDNAVYYLQNLGDPEHIGDHYNPIRRAVGVERAEGIDKSGRFSLVLADQEREGHGPPSAREFDEHFEKALAFFHRLGEPDLSTSTEISDPHRGAELDALRSELSDLREEVREASAFQKRSHRALLRELGVLPRSIEVLSRISEELIPRGRTLPDVGSFALRAESVDELVRTIRVLKPKEVLECGSGSSTAWIALCLEALGEGHLTSLEGEPEYAERTRRLLQDLGVSHRVTLVEAPVRPVPAAGGRPWYDVPSEVPMPTLIDVLLVDGPPARYGRSVRDPAIDALGSLLAEHVTVLVDDAERPDEKAMVDRWARDYGFEIGLETRALTTLTASGVDADDDGISDDPGSEGEGR